MLGVVERKPLQARVGEEEGETPRRSVGEQMRRSVQAPQQLHVLLLTLVVLVILPQSRGLERSGVAGIDEVEAVLHFQAPVLLRAHLPYIASGNRDAHLLKAGPLTHDPRNSGRRQCGLGYFHGTPFPRIAISYQLSAISRQS